MSQNKEGCVVFQVLTQKFTVRNYFPAVKVVLSSSWAAERT